MLRFLMLLVAILALLSTSSQAYPGRLPERRIRGESVDSVFFSPFRVIGKRAQISGPAYDDLGEYLSNPDF